jgi:hypothetical protein
MTTPAHILAQLTKNQQNLSRTIQKNSKKYSEQTKMDGVNLSGILMGKAYEKKTSKGNSMYTFTMLVGDVSGVRVPSSHGTKEGKTLSLTTRAREEGLPTDTVKVSSWSQVRYITTFNYPPNAGSGSFITVYDFYPEVSMGSNEKIYHNNKCKTVKVRNLNDVDLLTEYAKMPRELFHLVAPSFDDQYKGGTVFLDIHHPTHDEFKSIPGSYTKLCSIPTEDKAYTFERDDGTPVMRFMANYETQQWTNEGVQTFMVDLCMWENHLSKLGITSMDTWKWAGKKCIPHIQGVCVGYVDTKRTLQMDINDPNGTNGDGPQYGVKIKPTNMVLDIRKFARSVGYKVSPGFVKTHVFKGKTVVSSPLSANNPYSNVLDPVVINLHEFTGDMSSLFDDKEMDFFFLCDADIDGEEHEILDELSLEKREACFLKKKNADVKIKWKHCQVFAVFPPVQITGKKRPAE